MNSFAVSLASKRTNSLRYLIFFVKIFNLNKHYYNRLCQTLFRHCLRTYCNQITVIIENAIVNFIRKCRR